MSAEDPAVSKESSPDPDLEDTAPSSEFARALETFERARPSSGAAPAVDISPGTKVQGKIVSIGDDYLVVDFGGRSEGVAKTQAFRNDDGTLRVAIGDVLDMFVIESGDQIVLASSLRTDSHEANRQLREALASGVPVTGRVTGVNTGGLEVSFGRARGFCPVSQIESGFCDDPSVYVGRSLEFLVTSVEEGRGNAVLSRRKLLRRAEEARAQELLSSLKPNDELDGTVARLEPFGAFVDLGGVDGLVHVSEIRHERVAHPSDVLKPGEKVRVRVLRIEKDKKGRTRIALSIKACAPDPWSENVRHLVAGTRVNGTVARLTEFGAFITLAPGIDGLVHVSQVADRRIEHVREVLKPGQQVEVTILNVDMERKRVALSMRDAPEPSTASLELPARARSQKSAPAPTSQPQEPTTMALALRKAMEEAKRRESGSQK
jgi:small subunit ribosomal protein S1